MSQPASQGQPAGQTAPATQSLSQLGRVSWSDYTKLGLAPRLPLLSAFP